MKRLNILIFIPTRTDAVSIHHEFANHLAQSLSQKADIKLCTSKDRPKPSEITQYDLIHLLGGWSNHAVELAESAYSQRVPYLITPLGCLQPWEMKQHRRSHIFTKQRTITSRASAIHLCGKLEAETFRKLDWNHKVVVIKNPVLTSQLSFLQLADQMLRLYRKVLDSNARLIMTDSARRAIGDLLQISVDQELIKEMGAIEGIRENLASLTEDDWRRIFLYANDEQIVPHINRGILLCNLSLPRIDPDAIETFTAKKKYAEGTLRDDKLLTRNILLTNKAKDAFENRSENEVAVCRQLLNFYYELSRHTLPLAHLVDVYHAMRFKPMDEDATGEILEAVGMGEFTARLMAVLGSFLHLPEGYMLAELKQDVQTDRLFTDITKFGTYNN